jgi:hypothetical protein
MDALAKQALETLFAAAEKSRAGIRVRAPALTARDLRTYHDLRSLHAKESFETTMRAAEIEGCIQLVWEPRDQVITRVTMQSLGKLAEFIGRKTTETTLAAAHQLFASAIPSYPVLADVLDRWSRLQRVRGISLAEASKWVDALRVIEYCRSREQTVDEPVRNASAAVFGDSKRIEQLAAALDALLTDNLDAAPREAHEVWRELGLFREDQLMVFAGNTILERSRVTCVIDAPYGGYPADGVLGVKSLPQLVLSIENQTNFREEARKRFDAPDLLVYSAGMPSPAWRAAFGRVVQSIPTNVPIYHWGDFDEGGFRIAANIAKLLELQGRTLLPWRMDPESIPLARRRPASVKTVSRMRDFAIVAGWTQIAASIELTTFTCEQEGL